MVNGEKLATQPRTAGATETSFVVPVEWLKPRGNKVQISVAGGGEAFYSVSLIGFARGFRDADRNTGLINVERSYRATPRRFGDQIVPSGFDVIVGKNIPTFVNTITQLQAGESAMVQISFAVRLDADKARMLPLIVEEPIPAGCSVSRASIRGTLSKSTCWQIGCCSSCAIRSHLACLATSCRRALPVVIGRCRCAVTGAAARAVGFWAGLNVDHSCAGQRRSGSLHTDSFRTVFPGQGSG